MTESGELAVAGLNVSRETFADLKALEALVRRWNPAINLVGKASLGNLWHRHIADSAQIFAYCPPSARHWVDIGSGGGFPGLVVAILAREPVPALQVTLVESDQRKATFLRQAAQALGRDVTVLSERAEVVPGLAADVISARALAPLAELLSIAHRHLRLDGVALFPKGARHAEEIVDARKTWNFEVEMQPSQSDPDAAVLVIRKINRAKQD
jgi:16S rRNA (guanine527-N7)-methyltransferase